MKPRTDEGSCCICVTRPLSNRRETRLAAKTSVAVGHAHGACFMMCMDKLDAMLFAQIYDQVLVGIAHNGEQMVKPFGCHCGRYGFKYFHFCLSFSDGCLKQGQRTLQQIHINR